MSEISREAQRWGAMYAGIVEGFHVLGASVSSGFRLAQEAMQEEDRARLLLSDRGDFKRAKSRALATSRVTALSYPQALRREVDEAMNPPRATMARHFGWHDLADVIQDQEGRQIVRDGMRDVRVWLGEVRP